MVLLDRKTYLEIKITLHVFYNYSLYCTHFKNYNLLVRSVIELISLKVVKNCV